MACKFPLTAYRGKFVTASGRRPLVFSLSQAYSPTPIRIPCGRCVLCRVDRAAEWATRCMHEKRMHGDAPSSFVTLTYDDKHLPAGGTLVKEHLQDFNKRVRNHSGSGMRFYAAGEYGGLFGRPHYHILFFNRGFSEGAKVWKRGKRPEDTLYTSPKLAELWTFGNSCYGEVSYESCRYVAGYVIDKITGDKADDWYAGRLPEFSTMSKGIGASYYQKFAHEIYARDSVVVNGVERRPPRYYDDKWRAVDSVGLDEIKRDRRDFARKFQFGPDSGVDRRRVIERVAIEKLRNRREGYK